MTNQQSQAYSINSMRLLFDSTHDYKDIAEHIERKIQDLGLDHQSDRWFSLKAMSHFNLGISLELLLKFLLACEKRSVSHDHLLARLYGGLPPDTKLRIQHTYNTLEHELVLRAFAFGEREEAPAPPRNRKLNTVQQIFKYFDEDVRLWGKRYEWEQMNTDRWRHYLSDIRPFTHLIDRVMEGIDRP